MVAQKYPRNSAVKMRVSNSSMSDGSVFGSRFAAAPFQYQQSFEVIKTVQSVSQRQKVCRTGQLPAPEGPELTRVYRVFLGRDLEFYVDSFTAIYGKN